MAKEAPVGAWRSLVAHLFWVQGVGSSNLLAPTTLRTTTYSVPDLLHADQNAVFVCSRSFLPQKHALNLVR